jgi:hypothetical protein
MDDRRKTDRRIADGDLFVFDHHSDEPLGRVGNLTSQGLMLYCSRPVKPGKTYHCRMALPETILDHDQIAFEAECRWCKGEETDIGYQAGFVLTKVGEQERMVISLLVVPWDRTSTETETPVNTSRSD